MPSLGSKHLVKVKQEKAKDKLILANLESSKQKFKGLTKQQQQQRQHHALTVKLETDGINLNNRSKGFQETNKYLESLQDGNGQNNVDFVLKRAPKLTNSTAVTSTPNDKIQEVTTVPEVHHKQNKFASKFFLTTEDPDLSDTLDSQNDDSISPCKNVKQVKQAAALAALSKNELEGASSKKRRLEELKINLEKSDDVLQKKQKKPENYPIFGDALTESFQGEDLSNMVNLELMDSNSTELLKISKSNFEEWALEGLQISSQYEKTMKSLIISRLKFASQVNNLKNAIDQYGLALQEKKKKLEEKSLNLQHSGKKLVEEAKSF